MSPFKDSFIVIHTKNSLDKDLVIDVGITGGGEKISELTTILVGAYQKLTGNSLPVRFASE